LLPSEDFFSSLHSKPAFHLATAFSADENPGRIGSTPEVFFNKMIPTTKTILAQGIVLVEHLQAIWPGSQIALEIFACSIFQFTIRITASLNGG